MAKERIYFRVSKGCIVPADNYALSLLQARKFKVGDLVAADLVKPRNPKFNNLVHRIGKLVCQNIEGFELLTEHAAIKRLQLEGQIECVEQHYHKDGLGMIVQFLPNSLSFATMCEERYVAAAKAICALISIKYWPSCTAEQIERMAGAMID